MSDRETVTIDKTQYEGLDSRLRALADRIGPANNDFSLHQVLTHLETTLNRIAIGAGGGDNSQVLAAINNLTRKVDVMSSNIDRIEKEAADLAEDVPVVKQALEDLKTLVSDLKDQVAKGQIDQARLDAVASKLEKVDDDLDALTTTPAEEPPAEG